MGGIYATMTLQNLLCIECTVATVYLPLCMMDRKNVSVLQLYRRGYANLYVHNIRIY